MKGHSTPCIALDFSGLDHLNLGNGQFRYAVSLVRGLAALNPDADFLLIGSRPGPVVELADIFSTTTNRWRYASLPQRSGPGCYYLRQLRLAWFLHRKRVDLLHCLQTVSTVLASCPLVVTKHDLMEELFPEYEAWRHSRAYRLERWGVEHRVRRVICISRTTAEDLARLWRVPPERIDVVHSGVDTALNRPRRAPALLAGDGTRIFLTSPYNLEPRKNLEALLTAMAQLAPAFPDLTLVLFGRAAVTTEREALFEAKARQLQLGQRIVRLGFVPDEELYWLYEHAAVFVFPSLYEGFGFPLVEAMSVGACVVARKQSAMAEVVNGAGELVETADPAALAGCLASLLRDPERQRQLREAARRQAAEFTVERMARLTYQSYRQTLG